MRIMYRNTRENLEAFARHHYGKSKSIRRDRWFALAVVAFVVFAIFLVDGDYSPVNIALYAALLAVAIVGVLLLHRRFYVQSALKAHDRGERDGFIGRVQTLEMTGSELRAPSGNGESRLPLSRINRIDQSNGHTFIYLTPVMALMLSEDATIQGDYHTFVQELRQRFQPPVE